jgi:Fe2+ or Zn2+ uptake regulation protein
MAVRHMEDALHAHGLRITPQRVVVLEALRALSHPDAEAVLAYAQNRQAAMSVATVYNVLEKLRAAGLVIAMDVRGRRCFDIRTDSHDHVRCRHCGRVDDMVRHPGTRLIAPDQSPWVIDDQSLIWEGLCPACQGEAQHG